MRTQYIHTVTNIEHFKNQLLIWSQQFSDIIWLDSNNHSDKFSSYDAILAVDAFNSTTTNYKNAFNTLETFQQQTNDWIFGYLTYDLKNDIEQLASNNFDGLEFPELFFFQPKKVFLIKGNHIEIQYLKAFENELSADLNTVQHIEPCQEVNNPIKIKSRTPKGDYFNKINSLLNHIRRGDIYEANFCQEFYAEDAVINPLETYLKLNSISSPPFATFFKHNSNYLLSASPERYLKKEGDTVISQPIKGTAKRSTNTKEDVRLKELLGTDSKERSENIMIVDLVRNDLSKTAIEGSVVVSELCKVHSFKQVHQMVSTVQSKVNKDTSPVNIIKSTFPMGSMTGAPKISAMKIIEKTEDTKRGLYSGAIGYFSPKGDFDFNVVIRSVFYNAIKKYVSFSVGSAITAKSDPIKEYEECLVKAEAMHKALNK